MYMTKQKFDEIKKRYPTLLVLDSDVSNVFEFVRDMLEAEADALEKKCAYATRSIADTEKAASQVYDMQNDIEHDEFGDGD